MEPVPSEDRWHREFCNWHDQGPARVAPSDGKPVIFKRSQRLISGCRCTICRLTIRRIKTFATVEYDVAMQPPIRL